MSFELLNPYKSLPDILYEYEEFEGINVKDLVLFNEKLAGELNFNFSSKESLKYLSGNNLLPGSNPISLAYSGHQFGHFAPILGDGRATMLGAIKASNGELLDLQLKGAGRTFFSRRGDGRAPLGAALREYILSEANYKLGLKTTRALSVVLTDEEVVRQELEPGAIVSRLAKTHVRIGSFEFLASQNKLDEIKALADFVIERFYPGATYLEFFNEFIKAQAKLIASWMAFGFIHGVMNTDNVSIASETIDYGPCAYMNQFKANRKYSFIDKTGRYAYSNQPNIAAWNLARFAEATLSLLSEKEEDAISIAEKSLPNFFVVYKKEYTELMAKKFGVEKFLDSDFLVRYLSTLEKENLDYTLSFKYLEHKIQDYEKLKGAFLAFEESEVFQSVAKEWQSKVFSNDGSLDLMKKNNPFLIPRNHLVNEALALANKELDFSKVKFLNQIYLKPYELQDIDLDYFLTPSENREIACTFCGT